MFNNIKFGQYYPGNSPIHNMNAVTKIINTVIILLLIAIFSNIWISMLLLIITMIIIFFTRIPLILYLRGIKGLRILIIVMIIFSLLFNISYINIIKSILDIIVIVMYTSILTYTTKINDLNYGLEKVLYPLKFINIPVNTLVLSLSLAIRFIPTIMEEANKILKAVALRGIDFNNNGLKAKIKALGIMLIPMFILSFKRAEDLANAMELRLYDINIKRSKYKINNWTDFDNSMLIMHLGMLIISIIYIK
jgi:energy-coupling factor transport system permease protein